MSVTHCLSENVQNLTGAKGENQSANTCAPTSKAKSSAVKDQVSSGVIGEEQKFPA